MLRVVEFIKNNQDWREILSNPPYSLLINDDGDFIMLKYSQISSDFFNELVRECRGLIIDKDYVPVCVPFFKFANYGEPYADEIDWNSAKIEEKIDGSLIKVWNYKGEWIVSTNGTIFARNASLVSKHETNPYSNYEELFNAAVDLAGLDVRSLDPRYTYMFELCSPYNRVVVPQDVVKIYHIGTRDNVTLCELETDIGVEKPRTYECGTLDQLVDTASKLNCWEEGYVVKDKLYRRIKVKSPAYVAVHHLISGADEKYFLELIRKNETSEFLNYFPEYKGDIDELENKIQMFEDYINNILNTKLKGVQFETRKDYALEVTKTKYPAFFFDHYDGRVKNPREWLWNQSNEKVMDVLSKL